MADTVIPSSVQELQWMDRFFTEWVRDQFFSSMMGTDENSIIQAVEDLTTKSGQTVTLNLVRRLQGSGVSGDNTLEGNEEALSVYGFPVTIDQLRNAVRVGTMEQQHTTIDILKAARVALKVWLMDDYRDEVLTALGSCTSDGVTPYASCTEAQKDAHLAANDDRFLFGAAWGNNASNDHSAALAQVDSTNDVLDRGIVELAKRGAKLADPHIRPVKIKGGSEWLVMLCQSYAFRDLNSDMATTEASANVRGEDNPLYNDGDTLYKGVICKEVPEIDVIEDVGTTAIDVAPNYLLGAQALTTAWGQRTKFVVKDFDYGNKKGVSAGEIRQTAKCTWNSVQHGVLTVYTAGVADS